MPSARPPPLPQTARMDHGSGVNPIPLAFSGAYGTIKPPRPSRSPQPGAISTRTVMKTIATASPTRRGQEPRMPVNQLCLRGRAARWRSALLALAAGAAPALAGGGPENVLIVVNPASSEAMYIADYYRNA